MDKKISLMLAGLIVLNTVPGVALAEWESPLKKYNLYDDVTGGNKERNPELERVMDDYTVKPVKDRPAPKADLEYPDTDKLQKNLTDSMKSRNQILRESSRNVYGNVENTPAWEEGPSFYPNPSFDSIKEKYRKSDFAGCLQECTSYVRQNPYDTLGFYYLAMCYTKVNDKENAILAYEKVIELNDSPMIVKYATNGRNCIMGNEQEKCFENVNEPEYVYPYENFGRNVDLTPVDPQVLIERNLQKMREELSVDVGGNDDDKDGNKINLPFGKQDEQLDEFINSPYGNGLSPESDMEYKQIQLKKIKDTINTDEEKKKEKIDDLEEIKQFDKQKSDADLMKLAYDMPENLYESLKNDPEYIRQKQEYDELSMLLGNSNSSDKKDDLIDMLPYMTEQNGKNLSPEVIQSMMIKSMMNDISL